MKLLTIAIIIVAAVLLLRIAVGVFASTKAAANVGADKTALADCPKSPNCQSSLATRESQRVAPIAFTGPAEQVIDKLAAIIDAEPRSTIEAVQADYLHATFKTRLIGYTDDVEFRFSEDKSVLNIRSASRIGKSDLGANLKRIEHLRAVLNGKL